MFKIDKDTQQINITRGDVGKMNIYCINTAGDYYIFKKDDVVRFSVYKRGNYEDVIIQKDIVIESNTSVVSMELTAEDTRISGFINRPVSYWYEIQINPDHDTHTIVGHDEKGAKVYMIYPEGVEKE